MCSCGIQSCMFNAHFYACYRFSLIHSLQVMFRCMFNKSYKLNNPIQRLRQHHIVLQFTLSKSNATTTKKNIKISIGVKQDNFKDDGFTGFTWYDGAIEQRNTKYYTKFRCLYFNLIYLLFKEWRNAFIYGNQYDIRLKSLTVFQILEIQILKSWKTVESNK